MCEFYKLKINNGCYKANPYTNINGHKKQEILKL